LTWVKKIQNDYFFSNFASRFHCLTAAITLINPTKTVGKKFLLHGGTIRQGNILTTDLNRIWVSLTGATIVAEERREWGKIGY
jgi:hypothetical protein